MSEPERSIWELSLAAAGGALTSLMGLMWWLIGIDRRTDAVDIKVETIGAAVDAKIVAVEVAVARHERALEDGQEQMKRTSMLVERIDERTTAIARTVREIANQKGSTS